MFSGSSKILDSLLESGSYLETAVFARDGAIFAFLLFRALDKILTESLVGELEVGVSGLEVNESLTLLTSFRPVSFWHNRSSSNFLFSEQSLVPLLLSFSLRLEPGYLLEPCPLGDLTLAALLLSLFLEEIHALHHALHPRIVFGPSLAAGLSLDPVFLVSGDLVGVSPVRGRADLFVLVLLLAVTADLDLDDLVVNWLLRLLGGTGVSSVFPFFDSGFINRFFEFGSLSLSGRLRDAGRLG